MSEPEPDPRPRPRLRLPVSRQRLVEFTVVVFGVLVALGLENLIQEARFRADARDIEQAFVPELRRAVLHSLERQAVAPCLVQRLRDVGDRVSMATDEMEAVDVVQSSVGIGLARPLVYRSPSRTWITSSFDRAIGSEAFKRIPSERAAEYAAVFAQIRRQGERNDAEFMVAAALDHLSYANSEINAEIRADTLNQIAALDRYQLLITLVSEQIISAIFSLPEIGEDVRLAFVGDDEDLDLFKRTLKSNYGECVDLSVFDRLDTAAAS